MNQIQTIKSKLENLIKEWHLGRSAEAKYRCEAYKELLEYINSLQEEPVSNDLEAEFVLYLKHKFNIPQEGNTLKTDGWKPSPYDILDIAKHFAQWQALHTLETIKEMEKQAFLAGVETEQINKSFSKEELLNRWRNKL